MYKGKPDGGGIRDIILWLLSMSVIGCVVTLQFVPAVVICIIIFGISKMKD